MKRVDIDKTIYTRSAKKAAQKFAAILSRSGYDWAGREIIESVENNYFCGSNATLHNVRANGEPVHPATNDWSYYWGLDRLDDTRFYAWFFERS